MREAGAEVVEYHEDNAGTQSANVSAIIAYHNSHLRDLDVSVHFNASGGGNVDRAIGTETLYLSQAQLAAKVSGAIADASGLLNRGAKHRKDLSFLSKTSKPAILIEVCFVNSKEDVRLYQANFEGICSAIADAILGKPVPPTQQK
jgi:N-acetylmuramoyl-L-alanine amidase